MISLPSDLELSELFGVEPNYDDPNDSDWSEFFANTHFSVRTAELTLIFSKSETFKDCQIELYSSAGLVLSMGILSPTDVRLSKDNRELIISLSSDCFVQISAKPKISIKLSSQSTRRPPEK